jgi:hypothetical protein
MNSTLGAASGQFTALDNKVRALEYQCKQYQMEIATLKLAVKDLQRHSLVRSMPSEIPAEAKQEKRELSMDTMPCGVVSDIE